LAGVGCQGSYPIAASQCDEFCDAAQSFYFCGGYEPATCVLSCVQTGGDAPECHAEVEALVACLRKASAQGLGCQPLAQGELEPCSQENQRYGECIVPHAQSPR